MVVRKSKIKELAGKFRVSADFYDALNKTVQAQIKQAQKRAQANGRKTLRPEDL
jgi:histone H3/H4